jgi:hypothetical protein
VSTNDSGGIGNGQARASDDALAHLASIRTKVASYATARDFVLSEIFQPSMSERNMRSLGGSALIAVLKALDTDETGQAEVDDFVRFSEVPFLVVTLLQEETGVRVALLAAAYCEN